MTVLGNYRSKYCCKNCRILIEPVANIYYAVNSAFAIGYSVVSGCNTYAFAAPFAIPEQAAYTTRIITVPSTTASVADVDFNVGFTTFVRCRDGNR
jgi:hypothetical protein